MIMEPQEANEMVTQRSWDDFRSTGLLWFINSILHVFGWAIVVATEDGKVINCYPARVKYRGFDKESQSEGHKKVAGYLSQVSEELRKETLL